MPVGASGWAHGVLSTGNLLIRRCRCSVARTSRYLFTDTDHQVYSHRKPPHTPRGVLERHERNGYGKRYSVSLHIPSPFQFALHYRSSITQVAIGGMERPLAEISSPNMTRGVATRTWNFLEVSLTATDQYQWLWTRYHTSQARVGHFMSDASCNLGNYLLKAKTE